MTFLADHPRSHPVALCLALCLMLGVGLAHAADEQAGGANTFTTPGYPPSATQKAGAQAGRPNAAPAQGNVPADATSLRLLQNQNATAGRSTQPVDPAQRRAELPPANCPSATTTRPKVARSGT